MKTLAFTKRLSLDDLAFLDAPARAPGPRELAVRVRAVSLNYRDLAIARGAYGSYALPLVPGSDAAGEVVAAGPGVTRFAVGDRVCLGYVPDWIDGPVRADVARRRLGGPVDGVLREQVVAHEDALVRAPDHLDLLEASTLPIAGVTAWQALVEDGGLRPGDVVGVTGTGGVSLFVVQIARMVGARVIVVSRDGRKLDRVAAMGALTVDATSEPAWDAPVRALTGGEGVDLFVDVVGGASLARAVTATRVGGTVAAVGFVGGAESSLDLVSLLRRAVTVRAASGGSRRSFEELVRALEASQTRPVVDRVFEFDDEGVRAAFRHLAEGRPFGKVVIAIGGGR